MRTSNDYAGPMNLENPNEFSIQTLAERVIAMSGSKYRIVYHPLPCDVPTQRQSDLSLAWEPKIQLEQGLTRTINFFAKRLAT